MAYKFGKVSYINVEPLFALGAHPDFDFVSEYPAKLNALAEAQALDVCLVSAWIYPKICKNYKIAPSCGIFGDGEIMSVKLFSKVRLENLGGGKIFLTSESGSSVRAFAKVCLENFGFNPFDCAISDINSADAVFLIGNPALAFKGEAYEFTYDLGELWKRFYKLPLPYAAFVIRREIYDEVLPKLNSYLEGGVAKFFSDFDFSLAKARENFSRATKCEISSETLEKYYKKLIFKLPEEDFFKSLRMAVNARDII